LYFLHTPLSYYIYELEVKVFMNSYYIEVLANKAQKDFDRYSTLIKIYAHLGYYPKNRLLRIKELITQRTHFFKHSNFTRLKVVRKARLYLGQLERLCEYARNKNLSQQQEEKHFFTVRECNGKIKICGKEYPPLSKGIKRNPETFKTYDKKLYNSIDRAYTTIGELVENNDWEHYVTLTINGEKYDRKHLEPFMKVFNKWINNYNYTRKVCIKYIIIPEFEHGAWHLHGLTMGIDPKDLYSFDQKKHPKLAKKDYLNWKSYSKKFGFCTLSEVQNKDEVSAWYATKDIRNKPKVQSRKKGSRLYYCSHGLERSKEVFRGDNLFPAIEYDYENEWVGIKWLNLT